MSMRCRAVELLLTLSFAAIATAAEPLARAQFASGAFMIGVQGEAARVLHARVASLKGDGTLHFLFPSDDLPLPPFDPSSPAWFATEPKVDEGEPGPDNGAMWDDAHRFIDDPRALASVAPFDDKEIAQLVRPGALYMIEPDVAIWDPENEEGYARLDRATEGRNVVEEARREPDFLVASLLPPPFSDRLHVMDGLSEAWPPAQKLRPALQWHFDPGHSDLGRAREETRPFFDERDPSKNVLVYHLDTGYLGRPNAIDPRFRDDLSISFLKKDGYNGRPPFPRGNDRFEGGKLANDGHGTATLSILAGSRVTFKESPKAEEQEIFLGGAPFAHVASCRIGQSVVHFRTLTITTAINHAVRKGADLITMAAGGPPSEPMRRAVNAAYDAGVPMIFAAGDYFAFAPSISSFTRFRGTPHTTVYPARFSRAIAVTGVTYAYGNYADGTFIGQFQDKSYWAMRGSYGPPHVLTHSLAAYTPNVLAHLASGRPANSATRQFAGTSAATPQVAAAAALWLQKYRSRQVIANKDCHRAEAVYQALFQSARRRGDGLDPYFGRGTLDAYAAVRTEPLLWYCRPESRPPEFNWLRAAGILIELVPSSEEIMAAKAAAHNRMLIIEAAQLYHGSNLLQVLLGPDPERATPEGKAAFLKAVVQDPRASSFLKRQIVRRPGD